MFNWVNLAILFIGSSSELSWIGQQILEHGRRIKNVALAGVVIDLYDAAIQESSRRQYGTGQRAYLRFTRDVEVPFGFLPFAKNSLSVTELTLAFYMAYLLLRPKILKASTILNYETHVKWWFRREGCQPFEYQTPFLKQVRTGLRKTLPSRRDSRTALILPIYSHAQSFRSSNTRELTLLKFAAILGFVGMLRPHTFGQLTRESFALVVRDATTQQFSRVINGSNLRGVREALRPHQNRFKILGFYIRFKAKTLLDAVAYFSCLSIPNTFYKDICPVLALRDVVRKGYFRRTKFLSALGRGARLNTYLKLISEDDGKISPYALRIGGRTWYITRGLDKQLVDFLGTWSSPEASARYYRETPAAVLKMLQKFYASLPHPSVLY